MSYLTPSLAAAGLYRGLVDLRAGLERWRALPPESAHERAALAGVIQAQGAALDLVVPEPAWTGDPAPVEALRVALDELEQT